MAAVVRDVDGGPRCPGRGLLQVGARQRVARLVLLRSEMERLSECLSWRARLEAGEFATSAASGEIITNH